MSIDIYVQSKFYNNTYTKKIYYYITLHEINLFQLQRSLTKYNTQ